MSAANSTRCFIDTNLWLYALIEADDPIKHAKAKEMIAQPEIAISTQVLNELCVNLLRQAAFPEERLYRLIQDFYARYFVVELDQSALLKASALRARYGMAFGDSLIAASALLSGAECLYSEDMQHQFVIEKRVTILNPFKI